MDLLRKRKEDLAVRDGLNMAAASASENSQNTSGSATSSQAVLVIEDNSEKAVPNAPLLGAAMHDPVALMQKGSKTSVSK